MKKVFLLSLVSLFFIACSSDNNSGGGGGKGGNVLKDFNRKAMLTHWANDIIVPSYTTYDASVNDLYELTLAFTENPTNENLVSVREALDKAYMDWQTVAFYEVGPAVSANLRFFTNTYPTNIELLKFNVEKGGDYQLHLPSKSSQQGLPAMDYLLNGVAEGDAAIVAMYTGSQADAYKMYLNAVSKRLKDLSNEVLRTWKDSYQQTFINNDGSSPSASVDLVGNGYLLYYEAFMRNGKVRFPSGQVTNVPAPEKVESYYSPKNSFPLLIHSMESMQNFFNGKAKSSDANGLGFAAYLNEYHKISGGENIANKINATYDKAIAKAKELEKKGTLKNLIETDNQSVLGLHDIIQSNVIFLKVDMLQAMNIQVAYQDGDGD